MSDDNAYTVVGGRGSMTVFEIYVKTTPERLWEAITSAAAGPELHRAVERGRAAGR